MQEISMQQQNKKKEEWAVALWSSNNTYYGAVHAHKSNKTKHQLDMFMASMALQN